MKYSDLVKKAQKARKSEYRYGSIKYVPCKTWLEGNQINLWTYWQGYQLKDIDRKGVDILLVGQDWGNPCTEKNQLVCKRIEEIQTGNKAAFYDETASTTDKNLVELFKAFGEHVDIRKKDPGMRLFFTNYSLGYRTGNQSGGMTKTLMKMDKEYFDELVLTIKPKIIICLGKYTYEMVAGVAARNFTKELQDGVPFKAMFPLNPKIPVYGVPHCGSWGQKNVGGMEKMREIWHHIAKEYKKLYS